MGAPGREGLSSSREAAAAAATAAAAVPAAAAAAGFREGLESSMDELAAGGNDAPPAPPEEEEELPKRRKSNKRVSFPPDEKLASIRTYVPENPSKMISTRLVITTGLRQLAKLDARHERDLKTAKSEEATARDLARRMEPQISWYKPTEIKVEYGPDDDPPKRGEESKEKLVQKKREETRLARV